MEVMDVGSGLAIPEFKSLLYHGLRSPSQEYVDVFTENMLYESSIFHTKDE